MNSLTCPILFPRSTLARALVLGGILVLAMPAPVRADEPEARSDGLAATARQLDRELMLARRQKDLLQTLAEISVLLEQVSPWRGAIRSLLDPDLPPADQWRVAMAAMPAATPEAGPDGGVFQLRADLESLRADVALLLQAPAGFGWVPPPDTEDRKLPADDTPWTPARTDLRYVHAGPPGTSSISLEVDGMPIRLIEGESVAVRGRALQLGSVRPQGDGSLRIALQVDGKPHGLVW